MEPLLSETQVKEYQTNDILVIQDNLIFTDDEKKKLVQIGDEIEQWSIVKNKWMTYFEPNQINKEQKQLCRIENFVLYHPYLKDQFTLSLPQHDQEKQTAKEETYALPKLLRAVAQLMECSNPYLYKDKLNFKLPGAGGFAPHQDAPAFTGQGQKNHITVLIALDKHTKQNGCLEFVIGSTKTGDILPQESDSTLCRKWCEQQQWTSCELKPGDVVFFGSYIAHRSGPNLTQDQKRRAFYITYNHEDEGDKHDQYYKDKRECFPPDNERIKGKDYSEYAKLYNIGNPIRYFE